MSEIDKQIHEMMGLCWICQESNDHMPDGIDGECIPFSAVPAYSTDIAAAFEVVEWLRGTGCRFEFESYHGPFDDRWTIRIYAPGIMATRCADGVADTLPMAICLAALKTDTAVEMVKERK